MVILGIALLAGIAPCGSCHQGIWESYRQTAHALSSAPAGANSIRGSFVQGRNVLRTGNPVVYFQMDRQGDGFYVTAHDRGAIRKERFDLVMGSGRRGQSYLFKKDGALYQLPVSYSALADGWVMSPGYPDAQANFDRKIEPSCMSCHSTFTGGQVLAGLACEKCHGFADDHADLRKVEVCANCHSGLDSDPKAEVHGNQVGLLRRSRCFQKSASMSCATCHNVHRIERNLAALSAKCVGCHAAQKCRQSARADNCIECHMPKQPSQAITFRSGSKVMAQSYRNHTIGIYR